MVYLNFNEANQTAFFTLDEGRQYFATAFTHYLCVIKQVDGTTGVEGVGVNQILDIVNENQRATEVLMTSVGLPISGQYEYYIYGQNSASNTDVSDSSVVGMVERGSLIVRNPTEAFDVIAGQKEIIVINS